MSKKQKMWLWIFLGMFIVPEVLWSPVSNDLYEYSQSGNPGTIYSLRHTFLQNSDYINFLSTVFVIQLLGLVLTFIYLVAIHRVIKSKLLFWLSLLILLILSLIVFLLFGLSVSLRHIV
jgi:ABC-type bacteriocin/lantibiotic exporter with double-glycine peptidase domain